MQKRHWTIGLISIMIAISNMAFTRDASTLRRGERETNRQGDAPLSTSLMTVPAPNPPPGPDRFAIIAVEYTSYEWYVATWDGDNVVCTVTTDHESPPLPEEIYRDCGEKIYNKWMSQPPCNLNDIENCIGYYTFFISSTKKEKEIAMLLAPASAWISLEDCEPILSKSTNICETKPTLVFSGQEPLPNESIIRIEGTYDGEPFSCDETDICKFRIPETDDDGAAVEFWSYSSYGDSSLVYTAQVRVKLADEGDP
ncbi:MAG: hypothetical protein Q7J80_04025, partial [Anaerolineales bacterium]|nr:hypothetical protein [Anaerolineales bacterium]